MRLQGARTVILTQKNRYLNLTGNSGMATGGSGDVLTGIICGFLAGGLSLLTAARLGVYCHGLAGDAASKERDIIVYLQEICRIIWKKF